mgnify:CR=1 FL=1|jgi:hypothetical protein
MHTQTILGAFSCRSGGQLEGGTWDESSTHTHTQQAQHSAQNQHVQKSQAGVGYGTAAKHVVAAMQACWQWSRFASKDGSELLPAHHVHKPENGREKSPRTHDHYATHGNRVLDDPLRPNKLQRPTTPPRPVVHILQAKATQHVLDL